MAVAVVHDLEQVNVLEPQALAKLHDEFARALVVVDEMSLMSIRQARDLLYIADRLA